MSSHKNDSTTATTPAAGPGGSSGELFDLLYLELRHLARAHMAKELPGNTLQPTALVHEAYLRLLSSSLPERWDGPGHFWGAAARAMRRILVEQARRKARTKRGGSAARVDLDNVELPVPPGCPDILDLDSALARLERLDPRAARVVELKYFAGLTTKEIAESLGLGTATVERNWAFARTLLYRWLNTPDDATRSNPER